MLLKPCPLFMRKMLQFLQIRHPKTLSLSAKSIPLIAQTEIGLDTCSFQGNTTYTAIMCSKVEIIDNHKSVLSSFGLSMKDEEYDLPLLYWIPKLHKCPYKQCHMVGAINSCTRQLFKLLPFSHSCQNRSPEIS